ncbi:serine protease [Streptomyces sp. DSM 40750]|uniref:serine protease n=1 Tax=Streptomyces sp. DSM 40750 TaxID=2801030 RepID=UPI00214C6E5B|nr:serine protease [Streptomyces sp. DSM 40750]UUU21841.1 serine protease [Streptomyces sp. DSM 40750]
MTSASWHARISCGRDSGAGFLVTERHVLTCAHVIARSGTEPVHVSFAHGLTPSVAPDHPDAAIPARVIAHGGWAGRDTDPGDVAVLELDREVPFRPAEFAAPGDAYGDPPRKLLAYGFPKKYEEGTLAEYRTTAHQLIAGEWIQLEAWASYGQPLAPGFSGAAVTLADTGQVVGMVSAAARDPAVRNGRMLPATVMTRYWAPLGDLIPTPEYDRAQRKRLRLLIEAVGRRGGPACAPDRLYREAVGRFGPPPPRRFDSLWDAAWYLLSEVRGREAVARFAGRLADFVEDEPTRDALRSWPYAAETAAATPVPRVAPARTWSPILVEIEPSGRGDRLLLVEVSAYDGRHRRLVGSDRLPAEQVRAYALARIDEAYRELEPGAQELIAFVLPRRWLNADVAHWHRSTDDMSPLGSFAPLVVMDMERRRSGALQHRLRKKWRDLDDRQDTRLHRIGCASVGQDPLKLTVGLRRDVDMVGFATPPRTDESRRLFQASLNAAVPVMLWPRSACQGGAAHEDCGGSTFLDRLTEHLAGLPAGELPAHIHELREAAYSSDSAEPHWAHDLALLWEDPRCLPDPGGFQHSPVG